MKVEFIYCNSCGFEGFDEGNVTYSRQTADSEWYICPQCGSETSSVDVGEHTYGYYYPDANEFSCTHGGWSSDIKLIDETTCELEAVPSVTKYQRAMYDD